MNNFSYKDTVMILYPAGGYGSFLHWCLEYFSGHLPQGTRPFNNNGNAHRFPGLKLNFSNNITVKDYLRGDEEFQFGRTHGMWVGDIDHKEHHAFIDTYSPFLKKIVCLALDPSCHLLVLHNFLTKLENLTYDDFFNETIDQFSKQFDATLPVPNWQLREMLSFKHNSKLHYTTSFYQSTDHPKVINVKITDFVYNFQTTVKKLFNDLALPMVRETELAQVEADWLELQKFTTIDKLCQTIVESTVNNQNLDWEASQLTLLDEAYIQCLLRASGFEMKCFGLDTFPTNSVHLRELLYPV